MFNRPDPNKPFISLLNYIYQIFLIHYYRRNLPFVRSAFSSAEMSLRRAILRGDSDEWFFTHFSYVYTLFFVFNFW